MATYLLNPFSNGASQLSLDLKSLKVSKLNLLIYGKTGVGKTRLAGSLAAHPLAKDTLFVDLNRGLLTLKNLAADPSTARVEPSGVEEFETTLLRLLNPNHEWSKRFKTVVVDTITNLQEIDLVDVASDAVLNDAKKRRSNIDDLEQRDYKIDGQRLVRLFKILRGLPQNVVVLAQEATLFAKDDKNMPTDTILAIYPALTKKVADKLVQEMDCCWRLAKDPKSDTRRLLTQPKSVFTIKTRDGFTGLPQEVDNPDLAKIFDMFAGTVGGIANGQ